MHSCIYVGRVRHRRYEPIEHGFSNRLFMMYLDLAELDRVFAGRWWWSVERGNVASWQRQDYLRPVDVPLDLAIRDRVTADLGRRPDGPIRMLTHLRNWGYIFNPVTFYYCYDAGDRSVEAVVVEITNTPWNERHSYVLDRRTGGKRREHRLAKAFHVSPFMPMDHAYTWRLSEPRDRLAIHMQNYHQDRLVFDATLGLARRPISGRGLAGALCRFPWMTGQVIAGIYWQAWRLRGKGVPFHPHPDREQRNFEVE